MSAMRNDHPDLLELDALRAGDAGDDVRAHVASCRQCRELLEQMTAQAAALKDAHSQAPVPPEGFEEQIISAGAAGGTSPLRRLAPAMGIAAAALVLILNYRAHVPPTEKAVTVKTGAEQAGSVDESDALPYKMRDVNSDGFVDGDDVLELERLVAAGAAGLEAWDLNGDGATNEEDIDLLAGEIDIPAPDTEGEDYFGC